MRKIEAIQLDTTPSRPSMPPAPSSPNFMPDALPAATLPIYRGRHQICWIAYLITKIPVVFRLIHNAKYAFFTKDCTKSVTA